MRLQPFALGRAPWCCAGEPARRGKVDVFDASFGKAQLGGGEPVPEALLGTHGNLAVEHQAEPLVAAELIGAALFSQLPPGGGHAGQAEACI